MRQPKRSSKKVSLETLEKGIKNQPLGPPKEEGQLRTLWQEISKEEYNKKMRKGLVTNIADTTLVLVSKAANRGNQWHTKNPRKVL